MGAFDLDPVEKLIVARWTEVQRLRKARKALEARFPSELEEAFKDLALADADFKGWEVWLASRNGLCLRHPELPGDDENSTCFATDPINLDTLLEEGEVRIGIWWGVVPSSPHREASARRIREAVERGRKGLAVEKERKDWAVSWKLNLRPLGLAQNFDQVERLPEVLVAEFRLLLPGLSELLSMTKVVTKVRKGKR